MSVWTRTPEVVETDVGDDLFLVHPDSEEIVHLDRLAGAVWRALDEPQDSAALLALFGQAFPDQPRERLEADIARCLAVLSDAGLIVAGGDGPPD